MAKDKYHHIFIEALIKVGWKITHDPYKIMLGRRKGYIDVGAERLVIGAEKGNEKIAVEIKSFLGKSDLYQLEDALGQFLIYWLALEKKEPDRVLYLAMPETVYNNLFDDSFFIELRERFGLKIITFDETEANIKQWIN
ncbi:MAG: element excision factor XisH family protein [Bacteroidota bacterium]